METHSPSDNSPSHQEEKDLSKQIASNQKEGQESTVSSTEKTSLSKESSNPENNNANEQLDTSELKERLSEDHSSLIIKQLSGEADNLNAEKSPSEKDPIAEIIPPDTANDSCIESDANKTNSENSKNNAQESNLDKKLKEEITEEMLKDKVRTLQSLMKRVRKNFGILPASSKKRKASECDLSEDINMKKAAIDVDDSVLLDQEREKLMFRLRSYSNVYHKKPRPLTALDCAQHGWSYLRTTIEQGSSVAILECSDCSKNMFVADLDLQFCTKLQAEKIQTRYNEGLLIWHGDNCLWREKKPRGDIYKLPTASLTETIDRIRCEGKKISSQNIPPLLNQLSEAILKRMRLIIRDTEDLLDEEIESTKLNGYLLTLFGWEIHGEKPPRVICRLCFACNELESNGEGIDAIKEHQIYCPWRNSMVEDKPKLDETDQLKNSGFNLMIQAVKKEYEILVRRHYISYRSKSQLEELCQKTLKDIFESRQALSAKISLESADQDSSNVNTL